LSVSSKKAHAILSSAANFAVQLAEHCLARCGRSTRLYEKHNDHFLWLIKLLAESDPTVQEHLLHIITEETHRHYFCPHIQDLYSEYLTKEALEGFGDFKIEGQVICTVKYADDLVLLAREEKVLQGMVDRLIEIGRRYGMEVNVEKN
jgi:hypothetical protein